MSHIIMHPALARRRASRRPAGLRAVIAWFRARLEARRTRRALARLDARLLRDIGMDPADIEPDFPEPETEWERLNARR